MAKRKWKYNEFYFDIIDTYEKAYWFGFITADGYVMDSRTKNNKSNSVGLRIRLSVRDIELLESLNEALECNKPISIVKNYGIYDNCKDLAEFMITNRHLTDSLLNLGLSSGGKSCHESLPEFDDINLTKNYILGLFDGDGSISHSKKNEFQIVSSFSMCKSILELFFELSLINELKEPSKANGKDLYRLRIWSKSEIRKIRDFLYETNVSKYFLKRKYETFYQI